MKSPFRGTSGRTGSLCSEVTARTRNLSSPLSAATSWAEARVFDGDLAEERGIEAAFSEIRNRVGAEPAQRRRHEEQQRERQQLGDGGATLGVAHGGDHVPGLVEDDVDGVLGEDQPPIDLDAIGHPADELSMGMSGDYEVAVEEGATIVRLGTILFGARA